MGPVPVLKWLSGRLRWEWICLPGCEPPSCRARVGVGHGRKQLSSRDEQVCWKAGRAAGLPAGVCQSTEPQALAGSLRRPCHPTQALDSGPKKLLPGGFWAKSLLLGKATNILFCLGPCSPPSTGDIVGHLLALVSKTLLFPAPFGVDMIQPTFMRGREHRKRNPEPRGYSPASRACRENLTLIPRMPRPEEGQERK